LATKTVELIKKKTRQAKTARSEIREEEEALSGLSAPLGAAQKDAPSQKSQSRWRRGRVSFSFHPAQVHPVGGGIALAMLLVAGGLFLARFLQIKTVSCEYEGEQCAPEIMTELVQLQGQPLLFNDIETQVEAIPILTGQLRAVTVEKFLPDQVVIKLQAAPVLYQLRLDEQVLTMNTNHILQNFGRGQLQETATKTWPVIEIEFAPLQQQIKATGRVPAFYHQAWLELLAGWQQNQYAPQIEGVRLTTEEKLRLKIRGGELEFVFDQTDLEQSWQKYDYLWTNWGEAKLRDFQEIDLRFNSPVAVMLAGAETGEAEEANHPED
jgi:hypothetical protein